MDVKQFKSLFESKDKKTKEELKKLKKELDELNELDFDDPEKVREAAIRLAQLLEKYMSISVDNLEDFSIIDTVKKVNKWIAEKVESIPGFIKSYVNKYLDKVKEYSDIINEFGVSIKNSIMEDFDEGYEDNSRKTLQSIIDKLKKK